MGATRDPRDGVTVPTDAPAGERPRDGHRPPTARLRVQRVRPAYRQVADELRAQIMRGALPAGTRLPAESELTGMFGVSRSTVREALRVLASQHLIDTRRGVQGGSFVAAPDPARLVEDVGGALGVLVATPQLGMADLLEARLLLEPAAARLAAQRAAPETIEALRAAAAAPRDPRDPSGFVEHMDFHTTVLMATGNLMITMMGQPVGDVLRTRLNRHVVAAEHWAEVDACHTTITEHIARGEAAQAEEAMRSHLLDLRDIYGRPGAWKSD
ncbi:MULTISPECIES: FadR/GntR family transcriptional regulator [Pseudonocardia]|jgi:GntR family transcriptional repressor for pyruvate dehydrogenase complex|uniref:DNA-binding FadR family transcriptional regulator n=1 Tax=Pseudonocardia alni TaxID=33907 RepID=A0A852W5R1_PSEA5|nr:MULTISPECIES: FCD domain-containing protein [Pseudonocardia]MCO7196616.1 FCD domain-containing protein [Pseudonocardia sp. McavD-2-B]NYG04457.1 DNA-binding FadR family transcriptional regulator [Pseudonocardia antarctica]OJG08308.1 putative L-lactate dehydrogenase operon regulatory protein [Pseudonocardia autotrophica]PKB30044.1 GntR family transcriptional regulator [Pseudonocardia alni]